MAVISDAAIAKAAMLAGFRGERAVLAVAIALAESSGDKDVYNGVCCWGLWQIHYVHAKRFPVLWANRRDPLSNARMAFAISNGGKNWQPWEAYTLGMHNKFMPRARKAVTGDKTGTEGSFGLGDVPGELADNALAQILGPLQQYGLRIAMFIGGVGAMLAGGLLVSSDIKKRAS